jgi:hypothetical protein
MARTLFNIERHWITSTNATAPTVPGRRHRADRTGSNNTTSYAPRVAIVPCRVASTTTYYAGVRVDFTVSTAGRLASSVHGDGAKNHPLPKNAKAAASI